MSDRLIISQRLDLFHDWHSEALRPLGGKQGAGTAVPAGARGFLSELAEEVAIKPLASSE